MTVREQLIQHVLNADEDCNERVLSYYRGDTKELACTGKPFLTLREIAKRVNISRYTLLRWGVREACGHVFGGHPRYHEHEVREWLATRRNES